MLGLPCVHQFTQAVLTIPRLRKILLDIKAFRSRTGRIGTQLTLRLAFRRLAARLARQYGPRTASEDTMLITHSSLAGCRPLLYSCLDGRTSHYKARIRLQQQLQRTGQVTMTAI